jgi:hypothetical protein
MKSRQSINRCIIAGAGILGAAIAVSPAFAMNAPAPTKFDAGPLGMLDVSGGADAFFYGLSGAGTDSLVGTSKSTGSEVRVLDLKAVKTTGLVQFTVEIKPDDSVYLGIHPTGLSTNTFTLGPIYAAYVTLAPTTNFNISVGQVYSTEGFESSTDWKNPNIIDSPLYYVENSSSRGVSATYTKGPVSGTLTFGDGFDSGAFNVFQGLVTYTFDADNSLSLYGTANIGRTGPNTFAYGNFTTGTGYPNYNAAYVNSNMIGGYYDYTHGNITLVPEVQYVYSKVDHKIGLGKFTSNFGAQLIGNYQFGKTPWSLGGQGFYYSNIGPQAWYLNAHSAGVGVGLTPSWQKGHVFVRGEAAVLHLTSIGTGGAFGARGSDRNQVMGLLEAGLTF